MQTPWLEDFVALTNTRSFTRAAELCYVTHSAFGRRIKALEAGSGAPLVERGSSLMHHSSWHCGSLLWWSPKTAISALPHPTPGWK